MVEWRMGMARRLVAALVELALAQGRMEQGMAGWHMDMGCRLGLVGRLGPVRLRCMVDWRMGMGCRLELGLALVVVGRWVVGMEELHSHMEEARELGMVGQHS